MISPLLPTLLLFFSILFLCFILQVKPRRETSQGAPPPHQTVSNVGNGKPLRSASYHTQKGDYGKLSAVVPMEANTEIFHLSFFVLWFTTRMSLNLLLADPPWHRQPAQGAAADTPPAPAPTRLAIRTLNIRDVWGFGMAQAIPSVDLGGFYGMILTKMKISTTAYCWKRLVYEVTCSTARPTSAGGAQDGVGLVARERPVGLGDRVHALPWDERGKM